MTAIAQGVSDLELTYFNGRGLAETSRIVLALAGQPYKDTRYPLKVIDFSKYSFERHEFDEDKKAGRFVKSLGKVPFLRTGGKVICQSKAIERYLARRFGMMGATEEEAAQIDAFCEHIRDIKTTYQAPRKMKEGMQKTESLQKFFQETLPDHLKAIEESLDGSRYVVGDRISLADVTLFGLVEFFDNKEGILEAMPPRLAAQYQLIANNLKIKTWVAARPASSF